MRKLTVLGVSASLRCARSHVGAGDLIQELREIPDREALDKYLSKQAEIHLEAFVDAGRKDNLPFDQIYRQLQKSGGTRGLSNSEVALSAALWGAWDEGTDIDYVPLADHFTARGEMVDMDALREKVMAADGIILATPVYFGDRSSLDHKFLEFLRSDEELKAAAPQKVCVGVSVGAKRNGGQETTLIYQMLDLLDVGFLMVGNDSDTTSQYGGTGHAGDIGTMPKDTYGMDTCVGAGRRIGHMTELLGAADEYRLLDKPRVKAWIFQDRKGIAHEMLESALADFSDVADISIADFAGENVRPCIACDICPTHIAEDEEYRCIIARKDDLMKREHEGFINTDVVLPVMYSPVDRDGLESVYQQFMERTRYLRRGDYVLTDRLIAPVILAEVGMNEHLDVRMSTSFIRHNTVLCKPVVGWIHEGRLLNPEDFSAGLKHAMAQGERVLRGRLGCYTTSPPITPYHPVGYVLSRENDGERSNLEARERAVIKRHTAMKAEAEIRLKAV